MIVGQHFLQKLQAGRWPPCSVVGNDKPIGLHLVAAKFRQRPAPDRRSGFTVDTEAGAGCPRRTGTAIEHLERTKLLLCVGGKRGRGPRPFRRPSAAGTWPWGLRKRCMRLRPSSRCGAAVGRGDFPARALRMIAGIDARLARSGEGQLHHEDQVGRWHPGRHTPSSKAPTNGCGLGFCPFLVLAIDLQGFFQSSRNQQEQIIHGPISKTGDRTSLELRKAPIEATSVTKSTRARKDLGFGSVVASVSRVHPARQPLSLPSPWHTPMSLIIIPPHGAERLRVFTVDDGWGWVFPAGIGTVRYLCRHRVPWGLPVCRSAGAAWQVADGSRLAAVGLRFVIVDDEQTMRRLPRGSPLSRNRSSMGPQCGCGTPSRVRDSTMPSWEKNGHR